ncbi:hypothetical protein F4802DRAFT_585226 [Xylaria palmicola]|nr:hypothetical protein F4802DRAFT_585226 [Xylaria palmicola]
MLFSLYPQLHNQDPSKHSPLKPVTPIPIETDYGLRGMHDFDSARHWLTNSASRPPNTGVQSPLFSWQSSWWWWEILALVACIASAVGLVVLLKLINNTTLQQWFLPIQPNSVISILTTISKTAMLVPAASCLNQLKWHYFSNGPRKLIDLEHFDAASRGPWGSFVLIFQLSNPFKAYLALGLAVLTVLALTIDVSAQQLLAFPINETEVKGSSIEMGYANQYISKMGYANHYISKSNGLKFENQDLNAKLVPLQYTLLNSLRGSEYETYYTCPQQATRCLWDDSTTLGVCSSWNKAHIASDSCSMMQSSDNRYANCWYTLSNQHSGNTAMANELYPYAVNLSFRVPSVDTDSGNKVFLSGFIPGPYETNIEFGEFYALKTLNTTMEFPSEAGFEPPVAEAFYASFWWCSQRFQGITATSQGVRFENVTSERLIFSHWDSSFYYLFTESSGLNYTIDVAAYDVIPLYLKALLESEAFNEPFYPVIDGTKHILSVGRVLYQADLSNMTNSLASTLTNIIRSIHFDENSNVISVPGKAFYNETYIHVRWIWIIIPLLETALITLLFTLTIIVTSKEPLLKDSVLAYLSTPIRDDTGCDTRLSMTRNTTQQALDDQFGDMRLILKPDERGQLVFFRGG